MTRALRLVAILALVPDEATACAVCIDGPWGARGFTWPFVVLMGAPFAVVAGLAGLAYGWVRRAQHGAASTEGADR